jgi:hypothetical protein
MYFVDELLVVHDLASFGVVAFALGATETVLNLAAPGDAKLWGHAAVHAFGLVVHWYMKRSRDKGLRCLI